MRKLKEFYEWCVAGAIASFIVGIPLKFFMYAVLISAIMLVLSFFASKNKE